MCLRYFEKGRLLKLYSYEDACSIHDYGALTIVHFFIHVHPNRKVKTNNQQHKYIKAYKHYEIIQYFSLFIN